MKALNWIRYMILSAVSIVLVFPLYWMITGSLKPAVSLWAIPPDWFPKQIFLSHYYDLFSRKNVWLWVLNSVVTSGVSVAIILLFCSMAGYAYAKKKFPGHTFLFFVVVSTMMLPRQVTLVPLYILVSDWGLLSSYSGYVLPLIAYPFGVFLIRQFVRYIPDELISAASIDGAGELRLFFQIIVPLITPALGSLAIFSFMFVWNDYIWQLIVLQKDTMKTLPLAVSGLIQQDQSINYGLAMAGGSLAVLPMILFFLVFQKSFMKGVTLGTEK
jgi:multiple sugar transport system permease protein